MLGAAARPPTWTASITAAVASRFAVSILPNNLAQVSSHQSPMRPPVTPDPPGSGGGGEATPRLLLFRVQVPASPSRLGMLAPPHHQDRLLQGMFVLSFIRVARAWACAERISLAPNGAETGVNHWPEVFGASGPASAGGAASRLEAQEPHSPSHRLRLPPESLSE
jgi:hypothetical protein